MNILGKRQLLKKKNIVYYRVQESGQKGDLENQRKALEQFCTAQGIAVSVWLTDVGSGLNYTRKNFLSFLEMVERGEGTQIIIAHKDRLVRFGFEWFENFCKNHGTKITVMNNISLSTEEEMAQDLLSIIRCFSSRLHGLRKYKKKAQRNSL